MSARRVPFPPSYSAPVCIESIHYLHLLASAPPGLATYEEILSIPYLEAVVHETLRCASTFTFTPREALVDTRIQSKDGQVWPVRKGAVLFCLLGKAGWQSSEEGRCVVITIFSRVFSSEHTWDLGTDSLRGP